jgi:hydroxymethylglutaryl-CoA lyase
VKPYPDRLRIREVGPRDGLQREAPLAVADRVRLVHALVAAGVTEVEVAAFVSPRAVPAMDGAADVVAGVGRPPGVRRWALVPNRRGAVLALAAGVDGLTVTVSASDAYSRSNVHMSVDESVAVAAEIVADADAAGVVPDVVVSCAFGSPYEGDVDPAFVGALLERLGHGTTGAPLMTLADTTGMATPRRVAELVAVCGPGIGLHLHETRGTGLVNAYAAMELGVLRFDTSVGGLGGSPFAPGAGAGAGGNLATEDLVHLCDDLGVHTGIDLERLLTVSRLLADLVGHDVPSRVAAAGPRTRLAPA